jgi:hypothetical protein
MPDGAGITGKVAEIYEAHFGASAPYEINLPTTLLKQLKLQVGDQKLTKDMFNEAQVRWLLVPLPYETCKCAHGVLVYLD